MYICFTKKNLHNMSNISGNQIWCTSRIQKNNNSFILYAKSG